MSVARVGCGSAHFLRSVPHGRTRAMASAWKNVVPRREHRERPQPEARKHLGLLEKHKDYVKRARSHHRKRDRMTALKRRAELRNQDEFYYGMKSAKTKVSVGVFGVPVGCAASRGRRARACAPVLRVCFESRRTACTAGSARAGSLRRPC